MATLTRLFRRETVSTEFIPVIDGLRFLAILMVVSFHADGYIRDKSSSIEFTQATDLFSLPNIFVFGHQGVQVFFVISGFVLALPFMRFYFGLTPSAPSLRTYFLRRLSRLEPPYIISTIILFLLIVFVAGSPKDLPTLITSLFASLFYVHNFVFPGVTPFINHVTWSLEIEVQYYILAPFLMWTLCRARTSSKRRLLTIGAIVLFSVLSWTMEIYGQVKTLNLLLFMQYFLAGVLLCDIFLLDDTRLRFLERSKAAFIVGAVLLVVLTSTEHSSANEVPIRIASPLIILAFFLIVFGNTWWRRIFSLSWLTLIGGMCYSIYLLHPAVISAVGRFTISRVMIREFAFYYWTQMLIFFLLVLIASSIFFLLIEKPCMRRDWYLSPLTKIRSALSRFRMTAS
jgi:peptidoglycan/LPS O-acetylase OafA/YrhL